MRSSARPRAAVCGLVAAVVAGLAACRADPARERPASGGDAVATWEISAEPLLEIGVIEGEAPYQLHGVTSVARLPDGGVVVANGTRELRFFDASGSFRFSRGRQGEGPTEYRTLERVRRGGPDTLLVFDGAQRRISNVDPGTGEHRGSLPWPGEAFFPEDEWLHAGYIVDSPLAPSERGVVAAAIERLPEPAGGGAYARVTRQGDVWVTSRKTAPAGAPMRWSVYDLTARPVARVTSPARFTVHDIGRDWVLGVWRDSLDVERVRLHRVEAADGAAGPDLAAAVAAWDGPPAPSHRPRAVQEVEGMTEAVRSVAVAQEIFYSDHGHYTASMDSLREAAGPRLEVPQGAELELFWVEDRGWMMLARAQDGSTTCMLAYGAVGLLGRPPGEFGCWETAPAR